MSMSCELPSAAITELLRTSYLTSLKNRPHYWWSRLKTICGWQTAHSTSPLSDGARVVTEPTAKAEMLNMAFASQCSNPPVSQVPLLSRSVDHNVEFEFAVVQDGEVLSVLMQLNVWKATGLDGFSAKILQACAAELPCPLAILFNLSLSRGVYPDQWKQALIISIFKNKGNRASPGSYRPISLLSIFSRSVWPVGEEATTVILRGAYSNS